MTANDADHEVKPLDTLIGYITEHFPNVDIATYPPDAGATAWFFSIDREKHWPNFATIVTTDEHDMEQNSNLVARGAYRLNIGVGRATFERLIDASGTYDYTAVDEVIPHPTYAKQRWIGIVNPSPATFDDIIRPLLDEAYDRVAKASRVEAD
jgi:hypothetical protein